MPSENFPTDDLKFRTSYSVCILQIVVSGSEIKGKFWEEGGPKTGIPLNYRQQLLLRWQTIYNVVKFVKIMY